MNPILEIANLHVSYGKVEAVRGATLTMGQGQIVTIIGPNGAGKTTLLAAIMGLLRSDGRVTFDGRDMARMEIEATGRPPGCAWRRSMPASRDWQSAGVSWRTPCREASGRCWRSAAR
jgi:ABC-type branched-subunit amino acid transport system ATPase component